MTDFLTQKNKGIIWSLLSDQQMFDGINPQYKLEIQEKFEKTLTGISTQGRFYNLVEKNKEAIRIMVLMLEDYKKKQEPYTNLEIQERRQKHFESENIIGWNLHEINYIKCQIRKLVKLDL